MADINDYKIIRAKSRKFFDILNVTPNYELNEIDKERIGFYHLILENITGLNNSDNLILSIPNSNENTIDEIEDEIENTSYIIIDSNYNKLVYNINVDDLGIDAVSIFKDESNEINISLFNFKYRNSYCPDKTKTEGDISRSTKFLEYILNNEKLDEHENTLVNKQINKIIYYLNSTKICNINLYMVSNEAQGFATSSNEYIRILENNYGMKIINISLDDIIGFFNVKKDNKKSSFLISPNEFLSFQNDEKSTQISYILKLPLLELIRITSSNENLSNKYFIENDDEILNSKLDLSLLYDNVRGFLGDTKYNKNILNTLTNDHKFFFLFNNGITITTENIDCEPKNSGKKYLFRIENFQIVNGGQTIRSIYKFLDLNNNEEGLTKLRESYILLRIFKIIKNDPLQNSIAEYTNSQNAISDIDLKSIDNIQIQIENYFKEFEILYQRKSGDLGELDNYLYRISMEKLAQVLYSSMGYPDKASNQKKRLFKDYYDSIFKSENFSLENCKKQADKYIEIKDVYNQYKPKFKPSEQKIFYVIYIVSYTNLNIRTSIEKLEELIQNYESDLVESRKLIQKGFKTYLDKELIINN